LRNKIITEDIQINKNFIKIFAQAFILKSNEADV